MRLIFEHPWSVSLSIAIIGSGLLWVGFREGVNRRIAIGFVLWIVACIVCVLGLLIDTPTEHAKNIVYEFVRDVEVGDIARLLHVLTEDVTLIDNWSGKPVYGSLAAGEQIAKLHNRYTLTFNSILRSDVFERESDVLVELSLLSRIAEIGTIPSRWRLLLKGSDNGLWRIYSIDAIEIAGRSFR